MKRGEIWWADLPLPSGRRPVVLVSRAGAYAIRANLTVVEVSRTERGIPGEVALGRREGLPGRCVANADNLMTISKRMLRERVGELETAKVAALDKALKYSLGLGEL